ncbi:MAG: TonB-dependent receptor [Gemmatimonadota bacterium]|nr:TonB-dependent receptor [Gemmatimonadota bacterium]
MLQRVHVSPKSLMPRGLRAAIGHTSRALAISFPLVAAAGALQAQTGTVSGRVSDAGNASSLSGAQIVVVGTQRRATTGEDGTYRLQLSAGSHVLRANKIGYAPVVDTVTVAAGETATQDFSLVGAPIGLDQVVVTGTRATDRTVLEAPVPIDVLSAAEILETGRTEMSQVIQMLAPSINFPRPSVNDGTDHIRPATLRGLGPDQTLILINGKRRHTTSLVHVNQSVGRGSTSVDLNAIPVSAIERIEILRDGAAAQYGSDAIAGVINIILKSDVQTSLSSSVGRSFTNFDGLGGSASYDDGRVVQVDGNFGRAFGRGGFFHVTGEFRDRDRTNRARVDTTVQCIAGDSRCSEIPDGTSIYREDIRQSWQGDSESRDLGFFLNTELPLESGVSLYAFGGFGTRDGLAAGFFRRSSDNRTVRTIYPNGFLPQIASDIMDGSAAVGARGMFRNWNWDLSGVYGANAFEFTIEETANVSLGSASPTTFYAGALRLNQLVANLDFARLFSGTPVGGLNVAIGAEARRDGYKLEQGDENSFAVGSARILDGPSAGALAPPFSQVFPGFRPVDEADASRTNVGAYADVEATPVDRLLVAVAGRVENYSDFGSTADGKVAGRLELVPGLAVRGAFQTGFRAPSLGQSNFSSVATNFVNIGGVNTPFEIRTFAVGSPGGELLGARELKPEQSVNLSGGVTARVSNSLSVSADYYDVKIEDRIVLSGNFIDVSVRNLLANSGIPGVSGARYFTNAIDTRTKGLDIVLNYGLDLREAGLLRFTGGYNQNKTEVTRVSATPPQLAAVSTALFDRVQRGLFEKGQPKNSVRLTLNHVFRNLTSNVHASRFGKFTVFQTLATGAQDQTFDAQWVADAALSYKLRGLNLTVGANNILDSYPDTVITPLQTRGIYMFSGQSPAGFNGRYGYVRVGIDFDAFGGAFGRSAAKASASNKSSTDNSSRLSANGVRGNRVAENRAAGTKMGGGSTDPTARGKLLR